MNEQRKTIVDLAFNVLDKDGSGVIDPEDLVDTYDPSEHPDVVSGKKTNEEVWLEIVV